MAEQMPGELIYEYDGLRITGVTSYGAPPFDLVMSGGAAIPPSGARYDFTLEGRVAGPRLRGTFKGIDYIQVRSDGRAELHTRGIGGSHRERQEGVVLGLGGPERPHAQLLRTPRVGGDLAEVERHEAEIELQAHEKLSTCTSRTRSPSR